MGVLCSGWRRFLICVPLLFIVPNLFSVKQFQQDPPKQDLPKKSGNKFDHLVLGPAAGQGLPNRLQCEGTKSLNKTQSSTNRRVNAVEPIVFVTVFSVYNFSADASRVTVGNISYSKVERSMAILNVFINFIQETMPQSDVIILTDPASDLYVNRRAVSVYPIPGEYSREKLMLQRIRSYIAFLDKRLKEYNQKDVRHYIFTDSDIAVVNDLRQMFLDYPDFHLALTFRNNKQQPVNSGFIAVRGTYDGITRAAAFLRRVLGVYTSKYMSASRMLGDQLALAWVVASEPSFDAKRYNRHEPFMQDITGASVLFLPCAIYNWTPPEGAGQFHGMPLDVKVVHFKGSRKRLMLESWNFYNSTSDISDILCLILRSGRTKKENNMLLPGARWLEVLSGKSCIYRKKVLQQDRLINWECNIYMSRNVFPKDLGFIYISGHTVTWWSIQPTGYYRICGICASSGGLTLTNPSSSRTDLLRDLLFMKFLHSQESNPRSYLNTRDDEPS